MKSGITVAYSGVHQVYQLALAAEESDQLDRFYCSLYTAAGKWGGWLARVLGSDALLNRRVNGLSTEKVSEHPWPFLFHRLRQSAGLAGARDWEQANFRFDRWVARWLKQSDSRIFVGVETCAAESFMAAQERGMIRVLDCPQVHPAFLQNELAAAARALGLTWQVKFDSDEMLKRKQIEFELADYVLTLSELHTRSYTSNGVPPERVVEIPLWADPALWYPPEMRRERKTGLLQTLFVGGVNLRKGIPYLLAASRQCRGRIDLKLVGSPSREVEKFLAEFREDFTIVAPVSKPELRSLYWQADVLVLPSLVDSFGFVAMEAMACGLPVIVSDNCGVPVPDPAWRVPVRDSAALARRLEYYATNRDWLQCDGEIAQQFARQFTPERYRAQIKRFYRRLSELEVGAEAEADKNLVGLK